MENQTVEPYLYVLMRNDLTSLNTGKAMAQATHAGHALTAKVEKLQNEKLTELYVNWANTTRQGFGTTIVLSVNVKELVETVSMLEDNVGIATEAVYDPTYPYIVDNEFANLIPETVDTSKRFQKDGKTVMFRNEITCGYVFGDKNSFEIRTMLKKFPLHP